MKKLIPALLLAIFGTTGVADEISFPSAPSLEEVEAQLPAIPASIQLQIEEMRGVRPEIQGSASHGFAVAECSADEELVPLLFKGKETAAYVFLHFDSVSDASLSYYPEEMTSLLQALAPILLRDVLLSPVQIRENSQTKAFDVANETLLETSSKPRSPLIWDLDLALSLQESSHCLNESAVLLMTIDAALKHQNGWLSTPLDEVQSSILARAYVDLYSY